MDNSFLSYLLFLCLSLIVIIYLHQNSNKNNKHNKHNTKHIVDIPPINYNLNHHNIHNISRLPIHRVGPVINFHQHFTKYTNNKSYNTVKGCGNPTGIPELGWRNFYINNINNTNNKEVNYEDPFSGIITRNYLDNLDNVDNIYRK